MDIYTGFALFGLVVTLIVGFASYASQRKGASNDIKWLSAIGSFIEKHYLIFLLLIFAAYVVTRIFRLESFPNGLHVDEFAVAVDAKSMLLNGTDRWGLRHPAYFYDYGNGQSALYVYFLAFLLKFLPSTIFVLRFPAVFFGGVALFAMYGICLEITKNKGFALIGPILVTTLPVYFMSERWCLDAYLFLPTSIIAMYFIIRAIVHEKWYDYLLAGTWIGVSMYTYAVSYMVWPIFLLCSAIYLIYLKKITLKQFVIFAVPLGILATPQILYQLVNFRIVEPFYFLISDYTPLPLSRGQELSVKYIWGNILYIKKMFLGGDDLVYNAFPEFGTIYMFLLPFVFAGFIICIKDIVTSVKKKEFSISALLIFFWLGGTAFMLLVQYSNVNRVNELFMPFLLFIVVAVHRLFSRRALTLLWLTAWTGASFLFFMYFYFCVQNSVYGYHLLHTSATPGKAIVRCERQYLKDENTKIYVQFEDHTISPREQVFYFAAQPGDVYDPDDPTYGNVSGVLPEELDVNENAVYIIGDPWPHIISYLISEGFAADQTLPGYSILYRPN